MQVAHINANVPTQEYLISEVQDVNSLRAPDIICAKSLSAAKRQATRRQMFQGTVLVISAPNGVRLAVKENGRWSE